MAIPVALQRILTWLHAGYPEGVPPQDYFPVLALLARHLSDTEVDEAAAELAQSLPLPDGADPKQTISAAIHEVTDTPPLNSDIERVRKRLVAVGWPVDVD